MVDLSVIVPAKNEEKYIPRLLDSLNNQNIDLEVIVADACSTDKTRDICRSYGCKLVKGGLPAVGRNNGANVARADTYLFTDADTIFAKNTLDDLLSEFNRKDMDVGSPLCSPIKSGNYIDDIKNYLRYSITNSIINLMKNSNNPFSQPIIFSKSEVFEDIGGYDKDIIFGEDSEFVKRANEKGYDTGILNSNCVLISPRRFEKEGLLDFKYFFLNSARFFGHEFRRSESNLNYFS